MFYYGVVLIGEHLRSSLEEYVLANKTNLEHEINIEFVQCPSEAKTLGGPGDPQGALGPVL